MAPSVKHGGHRIQLSMGNMAAGSASDLLAETYTYDAFARGSSNANPASPAANYDAYQEWITDMNFICYTTLTGQATNFASLRVTHASSTATTTTVKNRIEVTFSSTGVVATAQVPYNLFVASGAAVAGGTLTVITGVALPWQLVPGDTVTLDRLSNNGTGLATPNTCINFIVGGYGA